MGLMNLLQQIRSRIKYQYGTTNCSTCKYSKWAKDNSNIGICTLFSDLRCKLPIIRHGVCKYHSDFI